MKLKNQEKLSKMSNLELRRLIRDYSADMDLRMEAEGELFINRKKSDGTSEMINDIADIFNNNSLN